ncbi:thaumatin-like protein 1b [Triticum dicoccoides]|uniref:thaumatin-like protein 1b n=1 Tax=Triticum dicoccoides TaxID=85692 RepID=UPI001891EAA7|nr:thaumatin-like protein 1b [Triticum dicoccoides]
MEGTILLRLLSLICLSFLKGASPATFTLKNNCGYTVWPGILSNAGVAPPSTTGFALSPGESRAVAVADGWSGRMWGRTLCVQSSSSGAGFACATGDCGSGTVQCSGRGAAPPATLAEFTLASIGGDDFYDVSLVDGFNVPVLVAPANGSCSTTDCPADLNAQCPPELRVVVAGATVACRSACEAFGTEAYCCSGTHGTPATCAPTAYSRLFKAACPRAYSYAYDDMPNGLAWDYFIGPDADAFEAALAERTAREQEEEDACCRRDEELCDLLFEEALAAAREFDAKQAAWHFEQEE